MSKGTRTDVVLCSCLICKREMSNVGLIVHQLRAHDNDFRFSTSGHVNTGHSGENQYSKAKITGETVTLSNKARLKISESSILHNSTFWTTEQKDKHSDVMLTAVIKHPDSYNYNNVCRRVKRFIYNGNYFHSSWEVDVAKYLDANNIKWTRKVKSFDYFWNGKIRQYFPDFYLSDVDIFLEVKGYEVDKDRAKWQQFPKKLFVLKNKEINEIRNGTYNGVFV